MDPTPRSAGRQDLDEVLLVLAGGLIRASAYLLVAISLLLVVPGHVLDALGVTQDLALPWVGSVLILLLGGGASLGVAKAAERGRITPTVSRVGWFVLASGPGVVALVAAAFDPAQLAPATVDVPILIWAGLTAMSVVLLHPRTSALVGVWCALQYLLIFAASQPALEQISGPELLVREVAGWGAALRRAGLLVFLGLSAAIIGRFLRTTLIERFEQQAARARAEAVQQQEAALNAAKTRFVATLSHELRTPLNAILGFAGSLTRDPALDPAARDKAGLVLRHGQHLADLVSDAMDTALVETGRVELEPRELELRPFLEDIASLFELRAKAKGIRCHAAAEPGVPSHVLADPKRLRQVLVNLASNALRHTERGSVRIGVRGEAPLVFEVADTGVGIAAEDQARIFEAFEQAGDARAREGGTGLGLAITQSLVDAMGGRIELESAPGVGTTVRAILPLPAVPRASPVEVPVTPPRGAVAQALREAAELGDLDAVLRLLDGLDEPELQPFVERARQLAQRFDDRAILELLEPSPAEDA